MKNQSSKESTCKKEAAIKAISRFLDVDSLTAKDVHDKLHRANLGDASLSDADLRGANLEESNLTEG